MKLKNTLTKGFIISSMLMIISLFGTLINKVSASESTKPTINNKLEITTFQNMVDFNFNGFTYYYIETYDRLYAKPVSNPGTVKCVVFYETLNGKTISYPATFEMTDYTNLEDVVAFSSSPVVTYFKDKTIKNLYMMSNVMPYDFKTVTIENYHFVASYKILNTDPAKTSNTEFNTAQITNCYYYDWNKLFFKELADVYNAKSGSTHNFIMKSESEAKYTKESFYPFEGFEPYLDKCGVKYFHSTNSSSVTNYKKNEEFPYEAYRVDERVKSITAPLLSSTNLIEEINFDTLDIRGYSLGSMSSLKGENIVVSNSFNSFNTQYIKFKNIYFVYDENGSNITSVTATGTMTIEKIYIPEANKTKFSEITNNSNLSSKIIYYTNEIKTDFVFTNTAKTKTFRSSDNFIDINTTLNSVQLLESSGVTIPTNAYINEFLATYQLPTEQEETSVTTPKYDLARFFVFTENIDIKKAVKELKPYLLYKNGKLSTEEYTLEYKITDDEKLELKGKYPDGKEFSLTVDYKVITSNVGEFAGVDRLGNGDFTLIVEARKIKESITAKDLMKLFVDNSRPQNAIPPFKLPITLTKEGSSTRESVKYKNANDEEVTAYAQIIITNNDLNPAGFKDEFYTTKDEF